MNASVFIATSLDGFIARPDGSIDWLMEQPAIEGEDFGYKAFFDSVDCLVMGRNTFDLVASFPDWPYEGKRVVVLSRTLAEVPEHLALQAELFAGSAEDVFRKLEQDGCKRIYVDGGKLIQSFLRSGLINDLTINKVPILLGSGISLFGELEQDVQLDHLETTVYDNGFVITRYNVSG